jgi:hypothetical protein
MVVSNKAYVRSRMASLLSSNSEFDAVVVIIATHRTCMWPDWKCCDTASNVRPATELTNPCCCCTLVS